MAEHEDTFRAYRIEESEGGEPKGRMARIGMEDLNDGELVVRVGYSNLTYKDALAATGAGKITRRLPVVGGIDVAGTVIDSEDPRFDEGDEVLVTGFGLSEDRDGGYAEYARLGAEHAIKLPTGSPSKRRWPWGPRDSRPPSRWRGWSTTASRRTRGPWPSPGRLEGWGASPWACSRAWATR